MLKSMFVAATVLWAVLPGPVHAGECDVGIVESRLEVASAVASGRECVKDVERLVRLCAPDGKRVVMESLSRTEGFNDMVGTSIAADGESCRVYSVRMRPYDHRGSDPFYVCSPARHVAVARLGYCD